MSGGMSGGMKQQSMLFVPASSPDKFLKALGSQAGAIILDLEDSVAPAAKPAARQALAQMLATPRTKPVWVRVNALSTGLLLDDLVAAVRARADGIVLPKCCGRETLLPVSHYLDALEAAEGISPGHTQILAIATETAQSLFRAGEYAGITSRLWGLAWGAEDLSADVGSFTNKDGQAYTEPYRLARSLCLYAAAAAGVRPIDAVCVSLGDTALVRQEAQEAFRDGFVGKMAIHPAQLAPINEAFTPSAEQKAWASRVIAAFDAHPAQGALNLDGQMIDVPHLRLARRILEGGA